MSTSSAFLTASVGLLQLDVKVQSFKDELAQ